MEVGCRASLGAGVEEGCRAGLVVGQEEVISIRASTWSGVQSTTARAVQLCTSDRCRCWAPPTPYCIDGLVLGQERPL